MSEPRPNVRSSHPMGLCDEFVASSEKTTKQQKQKQTRTEISRCANEIISEIISPPCCANLTKVAGRVRLDSIEKQACSSFLWSAVIMHDLNLGRGLKVVTSNQGPGLRRWQSLFREFLVSASEFVCEEGLLELTSTGCVVVVGIGVGSI